MNGASTGSLRSYVVGFVLSIALTLAAYVLVVNDVWSANLVIASIVLLAIVQLFVQLFFFLHLSKESKPRRNLTVLAFAGLVVLILVIGSLWIMKNLNYSHEHGHQLTPAQTDRYIIKDELINN